MEPEQAKTQNPEPVPAIEPVVVINNPVKDGLLDYALKDAGNVGSIVQEYEEFEMHGLRNVRVINTLVLCKSRFYTRLTLLQIPSQEYSASKFLVFLPERHFTFDEKQRVGDQIVFYKYVLMEEYTITFMKRARSKTPEYGDKEIMAKLAQVCPVFCQLVKFKYVDYKYELISYPDATIPHYDVLGLAETCGLKKEEVEVLSEVYIDEPINYNEFNGSSNPAEKVEDAVFVAKRTRFSYKGSVFAIERALVFWVKNVQTVTAASDFLGKTLSLLSFNSATQKPFEDGNKFEALILEDGKEPIYLKNSQPTVKNLLTCLFRSKLDQVQEIYNNVAEQYLHLLMKKKIFENTPAQWLSLRPGCILFVKTPGQQGKPSIHFGVYLGNSRVLHTSMDISVGEESEEGSIYKIEGIEGFIDIKKTTLVNALVPIHFPFGIEEVNSQANAAKKRKVEYEKINLDHENMPFEFIFGKRFSYEQGKINAAWLEKIVSNVK